MAYRRSLRSLSRQAEALFHATNTPPLSTPAVFRFLSRGPPSLKQTQNVDRAWSTFLFHSRRFSSNIIDESDKEAEIEHSSEDEVDSTADSGRVFSPEEKAAEAAAIGYNVIGPLHPSEKVFKPYEPVFAVVQIGSHQFKVSNGDCIFTERLKFCEVNDKVSGISIVACKNHTPNFNASFLSDGAGFHARLILNKVLLLGSATQTVAGRPVVPNAAVHAVVEEHALDAKVIIFKKKRRKNYRRTNGHRQELTKLRITDIEGIEKPEKKVQGKGTKIKPEKVAVAA